MNKILNAGKYIFPLSFLLYVGLHLGKPDVGASFVPDYIPFPYFWNYFTLVCIVLFIISALISKYDKLAYSLMALHLGKPDVGASFVPDYIPFPYFWNYFTLVCIVLFIISALISKYDKLAYSLMALYVILMALLVHLPRSMGYELGADSMTGNMAREKEIELVNFCRNIMVAAALMGFARYVARDKRIIG